MGLFDKVEKNETKNTLVFGTKKEDENGGRINGNNGGNNGGNTGQHNSNRGNTGNTGNGDAGAGNTGGGLFQLSIADSNPTGTDEQPSISNDGTNGLISFTSSETEQQSHAEEKHSSRPSFLNFGQGKKEKEKETKIADTGKDAKIKKGSQGRKKKGEYLSDEQVEILFTSLFDAFALFRGEHWKVQEHEKNVVPALTRILNRMLEILPKGISNSAFNIMDYVIVIGAIAGMIVTRIKIEKGSMKIVQENQGNRIRTSAGSGNSIQAGNEIDNGIHIPVINEGSQPNKGNENGTSILSPIADLTKSINRIS